MKIEKTVTEKVIAANRENAAKSTGPRDTTSTRQNARKHGLLAKQLKFETDDERQEFDTWVQELEDDWRPQGFTERTLVYEVAISAWKLTQAIGWQEQEFADRRAASTAILECVTVEGFPERRVMFKKWDTTSATAKRGWDCEELVLRTSDKDTKLDCSDTESRTGVDNIQIEAKLRTRLDTIFRYQASLRNNFYRAIKALREFRRERRGS